MNEEITLMDRIKKLYRPVGKITDYIPLSAAITFILVLVSSMVGLFITAWLLPPAQTRSPAMQMFAMYFNTIGAWVVALLLILILPGNHKMLKAAGPGMKGNTLKWILYGILIGFGANTFCVLMSILFKDISLSFSQFNIGWCLALFFAVMIQSGSEELLCRLYMFQKLRRRYKSPWVAVVVNSVFFGALHMGNQGANFFGIAQCVIFGFLASILVWKYKSFWGECFAKRGELKFSYRLFEKDRELIRYVVVHEFAHFIEPNHSSRFWAVVAEIVPDYKELRKRLNNK